MRIEVVPLAVLARGARSPQVRSPPGNCCPARRRLLRQRQEVLRGTERCVRGRHRSLDHSSLHAYSTGRKRERLGEEHHAGQAAGLHVHVNPVFVVIPESTVDAPSLSAVVNDGLVVHAQLGTPGVGSTLDYDGKACKLTKLPK